MYTGQCHTVMEFTRVLFQKQIFLLLILPLLLQSQVVGVKTLCYYRNCLFVDEGKCAVAVLLALERTDYLANLLRTSLNAAIGDFLCRRLLLL